jgi:hypothetical protein
VAFDLAVEEWTLYNSTAPNLFRKLIRQSTTWELR